MSAIRKLLENTPVSSIPVAKGKVFTIPANTTPYDGFKLLLQENILSAPVLDENGKCTGFLDMRDLVSFVVFIDDDQHSDVPNDLEDIIVKGAKLLKIPTEGASVIYLSRRNPFYHVKSNESLWKVCEILAKGVHRVAVLGENETDVINIISQSSIINFLEKHKADIKHEFSKTIHDLHIGTQPVYTVKKDTTAIETFRLMDNRKISGVAVVDHSGRFIGNTSASDLKLFIKTLSLALLRQPIMEYLKIIRQESVDIVSPTISCSTKDTLAIVIAKLSSTKIHKIFVADDDKGFKPYCVVSITDIIRYLIKSTS